jgi:hypothetical protein
VWVRYCRPPQGLPNNETTQPVDFELANERRRPSDGSVTSLPIRAASRFTSMKTMPVARQVRTREWEAR